MNSELNLYSNTTFYKHVLHYIYTKYSDQIKCFEYVAESTIKPYNIYIGNQIILL